MNLVLLRRAQLFFIPLAFCLFWLSQIPAQAQTYDVSSTAGDSSANSLGAAFADINADSPAVNNTIDFENPPFNSNQTITLSGSYDAVVKNTGVGLTLSAPLDPLTIAGTGYTVFNFSGGGTLNTSNLIIAGNVILGANSTWSGSNTANGLNLSLGSGSVVSASQVLAGGGMNVTASGNSAITGQITGTGALSVAGAGTLTLNNSSLNNNYSGGTNIGNGTNGTLSISNANQLGSGTLTFNNGTLQDTSTLAITLGQNISLGTGGGTLSVTNSDEITTLSGVISGSGTLTVAGAGILNLAGTNTYTGNTTITSGSSLQISASNTYAGVISGSGGLLVMDNTNLTLTGINTFTGAASVGSDSTLTFSPTANETYGGNISGTGSLSVAGTHTLTLTGSIYSILSTYISAGASLSLAPASATMLYTGLISGVGGLNINGGNEVVLTGSNTYIGGTVVTNGTLLGNTTSLQGNITDNSSVIFDQTTAGTYAGNLSGTGTLTNSGTGTVTLSGTNTYSGGTSLNSGTLSISAGNKLGTGTLTLNGGTLQTTATATLAQNVNLLSGGGTFDVTTGTATLSGLISGSGNLNTAGTGTLTLTGVNTYTGNTFIGTGSSLNLSPTADLTYAGNISGGGSLLVSGSNTLTLEGANSYTGGTTIAASSTLEGYAGSIGSLQGNITNNGELVFNQTSNGTYAGTLLDSGTLEVTGGNTLTMTGQMNFTPMFPTNTEGIVLQRGNLDLEMVATTVNFNGTLEGESGSVLTIGNTANTTLGLYGDIEDIGLTINIGSNGTLVLGSNTEQTIGPLTGTGSLSIENTSGPGYILFGQNTFSGETEIFPGASLILEPNSSLTTYAESFINDGTLIILAPGDTVTFTGTQNDFVNAIELSGTTLVGNTNTLNGNIQENMNAGFTSTVVFDQSTADTFAYTGIISDFGSLVQSGPGTLTLDGANTYAGATTISSGTIALGINNALPTSTTLADSGTLDLSGFSQSISSITGSGVITNSSGTAGTLTVANTGSDTYAGTLTGNLALDASGTGTLTLSGNNTYTGGTNVGSGSTLQISAGNQIGTGTLTLNGGILQTTAGFTLSNAVNLGAGGGTFDVTTGTTTLSGGFAGTGTLTTQGAGTLNITGAGLYTGDTVIYGNTLELSPTANVVYAGNISGTGSLEINGSNTLTLSGTNTYNGSTDLDGGTLSISSAANLPGASTLDFGGGALQTTADGIALANTIVGAAVLDITTGTLSLTGNIGGVTGLTVNGGILSLAGSNMFNGSTDLQNSAVLDFAQSADIDDANNITGIGGVAVDMGANTLTLAGTNTYTGDTTLNSGVLAVSSASNLGNSANLNFNGGALLTTADMTLTQNVNLNASGAINVQNTRTQLSGTLSGSGSLTKQGAGTLALTGSTMYSGDTDIQNGTVDFAQTANINYSGNITNTIGTGTVAVDMGSKTLTLSGTNSYSGGTALNSGTLNIGNNSALGSGALTMANGTTLQAGLANLTIGNGIVLNGVDTYDTNGDISTLSGTISGTGGLEVVDSVGAGVVTISGDNTYQGGTTINAGTVVAADDSALGTGLIAVQGGNLLLDAGVVLAGNGVSLSSGTTLLANTNTNNTVGSLDGAGSVSIATGTLTTGGNNDSTDLSGVILGSGGLTKDGSGTLNLSGNNTYTGGTSVNAGTLAGNTSSLQGNIINNANVVFNQNTSGVYAGLMSGTGSLSQSGTGVLTLSNTNTYSGPTNINSGTIALGINNALPIGTSLSDSGTLDLNGNNQQLSSIAGSGVITNSSGAEGTLTVESAGTSTFAGTLSGNLALNVLTNLNLSGNNTYTGPTTLMSGTLNALSNTALGTGILNLDGGTFNGGANTTLSNIIGVGGLNVFLLGNSGLNLSGEIALGGNNLIFGATQTGGGQVVSGATTFSGEVYGSGSLQMEANTTATLVLTANNGIGSIQMFGGTLQVGYATALGTAAITIGNGATLQSGVSGLDLLNYMDLTGSANYDTNGFNTTLENEIVGPFGSLTKLGSGTLTLAYANTYGEGTTVMEGTLNMGCDGAIGSVGGGLVLENGTTLQAGTGSLVTANAVTLYGADTYDANGFDSALTGNIAGTGSLLVTDSTLSGGILTLTGTNTYSGGTTVENSATLSLQSGQSIGSNGLYLNGGTLQASALGTGLLLSQAVTLGSNGGTFDANGLNSTLAGVISGTGGFTVTDSSLSGGILTLTGMNTYTGGTTINSGTLSVSSDANLGGTGGGLVINNGILQLTSGITSSRLITLAGADAIDPQSGTSTLNGQITGTGELIVTGPGLLVLTNGTNNYSGNTFIQSGTLGIDSGADLGTGNLFMSAGILDLLGSGTMTQAIHLIGGGTIDTASDTTSTLSGAINGTNSLTKTDSGTLILSASNGYLGGTQINGGTLVAANSNALGNGNVAVNAGGTLAVSGPLALNITGTYTQSPTGTLQLGLGGATAGLYDSLNITGAATLGGTLKLVPYSGYQLHDTDSFTLLTASSITGNFTTVTDGLGGDAVSLVYGLGSVTADAVVVSLAPSAPSFTALGQTGNQKSVGAALDDIATNTPNNSLITYLNTLSNSAFPGVLDQMSASNLTPMFKMNFSNAQAEAGLVSQHLSELLNSSVSSQVAWNNQGPNGPMFAGDMPASQEAQIAQTVSQPERWNGFVSGMTSFGTVTSDGNGAGYQFSTGGTTAGADYRFEKNLTAGLMIGYDQSGTSQSTGTVAVSGGQLGLYAGWKKENLHIDALVDGGLDSYTTLRQGLGGNANGSTSGTQFTGLLNAGYDMTLDDYQLSPFAAGQLTQVNVTGFTETGSFSPLTFGNQGEAYVSSDLGVKVSRHPTLKWGIRWSPYLSAAWEHVYQGSNDSLSANLGSGNNFTVAGSTTGTDGAVLGAGFTAEFDKNLNLYASYQGKVGLTNYTDNSFSGGVNIGF